MKVNLYLVIDKYAKKSYNGLVLLKIKNLKYDGKNYSI